MNKQAEQLTNWIKGNQFLLIIVVLIGVRFFNFEPQIDGPHTWRQADTANFIWDFHENGIDLFNPSVCWMGGHKTLILEFPLPEAIIAVFYNVFSPDLFWARLIFLLFFAASALFLYRLIKEVSDQKIAQLATIIYAVIPLALFYSRAIHIDFTALFFAFAMTYYFIIGIRAENTKHLLIGALLATLAFLIKAPYAFYFAVPLLYFVYREKKFLFCIKKVWVFAIPLVAFVGWLKYSFYVNNNAPDWEFIPGYRKFTDNGHWYYGTLEQRMEVKNWETLLTRFQEEITGKVGFYLMLFGLAVSLWRKKHAFLLLWAGSMLLYVGIFFNLNVVHNYYQIPLIAPAAIFMAIAILEISKLLKVEYLKKGFVIGATVWVFITSWNYAEENYYKVNWDQIEIGEAIKGRTEKEDLIAVTYGGLNVHCPNILYRARRNGWMINVHTTSAQVAYKLKKNGATHYAFLGYQLPQGEFGNFLNFFKKEEIELKESDQRLYLYDLRFESDGKPYNEEKYN